MTTIKADTVLKCTLSTEFCGIDDEFFVKLMRDFTEDELDAILHELAIQNAAMYGIYPEEEELEEDGITYSSNICGYYEVVTDTKSIYGDIEEWG